MDSTPQNDRIALVTGAGSGVGRACATALARAGWRVVLAGRRADALEASRAGMAEAGIDVAQRVFALPADVSDAQSVARLFDTIRERFARLDLLFNNAGRSAPATPIEDLSLEQWRSVVDTNLTGVFLCMQQAFKLMKSQSPRGGRIINNGSISAYAPRPGAAPYNATKHGVLGLTKSGALEGRAHDIAVGQIDIGNASTEMTERMDRGALQADGTLRTEPRMDVQNVADALVMIASLPLSANVQNITVMATKMPFIGRG
jgi:NAD(P)-dependent dehydrogenase (short-subunit alcohol dehydrogenase family)